ncbi:MAG TPA: hypothetical protein VMU28_13625 [Terriglobales bacterium]|nr:hypothetical protein [Terriglobales bacterium]
MKSLIPIVLILTAVFCVAQEQPKPAQEQSKPVVSPSARLAAAKTAYIKNGGGNEMPFNIISSAIDSWGRFIPADSPEAADIIIEITSYVNDVGSTQQLDDKGNPKARPDVVNIKMVVSDARTHLPLWSSNERPKGAFKQKTVEENIADASEKLLEKFHDRLEPPAPADQSSEKSK